MSSPESDKNIKSETLLIKFIEYMKAISYLVYPCEIQKKYAEKRIKIYNIKNDVDIIAERNGMVDYCIWKLPMVILKKYRRFVSRHGNPALMTCDNWKNFVLAQNSLKNINDY